jgi:alpha/beta superfamily hydrolase
MSGAVGQPVQQRTGPGEALHEIAFIGAPERRLLAVHRAARAPLRAAFVLCPPFFHEQFLSYRLLSLVAARLAERGIASLRFDYFGSADSWGEETEFSLEGAVADTETALAELARLAPGVPLIAFGARAGAWPAATIAARHRLPLWLWQPMPDGAAWLAELEAMDARERGSRLRYAFIGDEPKPADPQRLLGSYCPPEMRARIAQQRLADLITRDVPDVQVVDDEHAPALAAARQILRLPTSATGWHAYIDMKATFITPPVAACIEGLAQSAPSAVAA